MAVDDTKDDLEALSALETEAREFDKVRAACNTERDHPKQSLTP